LGVTAGVDAASGSCRYLGGSVGVEVGGCEVVLVGVDPLLQPTKVNMSNTMIAMTLQHIFIANSIPPFSKYRIRIRIGPCSSSQCHRYLELDVIEIS
jgi:hypothetical protein